jgi:hypothetical protein
MMRDRVVVTEKRAFYSLNDLSDPSKARCVRPCKLGLAASDSTSSPLRGHSTHQDGYPRNLAMFAQSAFFGADEVPTTSKKR